VSFIKPIAAEAFWHKSTPVFAIQVLQIFWMILVAANPENPRNFCSAVAVGRFMDIFPFGTYSISALLIGPTYPLRNVQTPNKARKRYFTFCDK
jgi:uncharacterized protein (DUF2062 family)